MRLRCASEAEGAIDACVFNVGVGALPLWFRSTRLGKSKSWKCPRSVYRIMCFRRLIAVSSSVSLWVVGSLVQGANSMVDG